MSDDMRGRKASDAWRLALDARWVLAGLPGCALVHGCLRLVGLISVTARRVASEVPSFGAAALAVVVLASCSGNAPAAPARAASSGVSSPVPAASQATAGGVRAQVLSAYLGMWHAYVAASRTADYRSAPLARYAAGDALSVLTHGLYDNYRQGIVTRGQPSFHPEVTVAYAAGRPVSASVSDCASSANWRGYHRSGRPAGGAPAGHRRISAWLLLFYGAWKVTYLVVGREGTC